jgi:hypothetical protein
MVVQNNCSNSCEYNLLCAYLSHTLSRDFVASSRRLRSKASSFRSDLLFTFNAPLDISIIQLEVSALFRLTTSSNIWYQSEVRLLQAVICCNYLSAVFNSAWTSKTCDLEKIRMVTYTLIYVTLYPSSRRTSDSP